MPVECRTLRAPAPTADAAPGGDRVRILVGAADPAVRSLVRSAARALGCEAGVLETGGEAMDPGPRLVVVDRPGATGDERGLCARLRTGPAADTTYVLVLAGPDGAEERGDDLLALADDRLAPPFGLAELTLRLEVGLRVLARDARMETRIQERAAAFVRAAAASLEEAAVLLDLEGVIRDLNPPAQAMFGWSAAEATGRPACGTIVPEVSRAAIEGLLARLGPAPGGSIAPERLHGPALRRTGEEFIAELTLLPFRMATETVVCLLVRDVTEQTRLELERAQASKLESVGRLAAGVAHEINTPIQFVGDNVRFLRDAFDDLRRLVSGCRGLLAAVPPGTPSRLVDELRALERRVDCDYLLAEAPQAIAQTLDGIERVATIVRAMKEFAHPPAGEGKDFADINHALTTTLTVARNELKYVATIDTDFGDLPPVFCRLTELNQVFLNLLVNAAHAIEDVVRETGEKGRITVRTGCDGDHVVVAVSDTGRGIPPGVQRRVFDPFFTTKEPGRGSGQGLAIARSIVVEMHGGSLSFETEPGRGTTFFVRLPIALGAAG